MSESDKDSPFHYFQRNGATVHQLEMLKAALRDAPELNRRMTAVMQSGDVSRIGLLPNATGSSGGYDPLDRKIRFKPSFLDDEINRQNVDKVVDVMAHEVSHASRRQQLWQISNALDHRAFETAQNTGPRDWTQFVRDAIAYGRYDEARAELDGINVLADRIRNGRNTPLTESELAGRLYATSACVELGPDGKYLFKHGVRFDPVSQSVQPTQDNLKAVARYHFDQNPFYPHFYASNAISKIAAQESTLVESGLIRSMADNRIDLAALGLDRASLSKQSLARDSGGPFQFVDTSGGQQHWVQMKSAGNTDAPEARPELAVAPLSDGDRGLLNGLRDRLRAIGQWDDDQLGNIAAALLVQVRREPLMQRVDEVVLGHGPADGRTNVFALHKPFGDKAPMFNARVDAALAMSTPMQASMAELQAVNQQWDVAREQALVTQHDGPEQLVRRR